VSYFLKRMGMGALVWCSACSVDNPPISVPTPDKQEFALEVYPVLLRDCGFPECHGSMDRFFRVFGPGRLRISMDVLPYDPATPKEIQESYDRARSMLEGEDSVLDSDFLRKPLAKAAGGAGHKGEDVWGHNVYATTQDPDYQVLVAWALSQQTAVAAPQGGGTTP
jgi:hypothetical protein